jgi:outer membrane immunogenic protein
MRLKLAGYIFAACGLLAAQSAFAADMPAKMPVKAAPLPMWNWTGFYVGAYAGVGLNRSHGYNPTGSNSGELNFLGTGFTGGATAGYNWQFAPNWVAGVEGDIGYLGLGHNVQQYNEPDLRTDQKTSWIGTARVRFGYTDGPTLSYVTGGAAWIHTNDVLSNLAGTVTAEDAKTRTGFTVGTGVETRLGGNWTAKSEYLYADVGRGNTITEGTFTSQTDQHRYSMVRFGLNYLLGSAPMGPLPQHNWGGFYAGIVGGGALTQTKLFTAAHEAGEFGNNGNGYTFGLLAGYNWQFAPAWIAGVEGDVSWLGINHSVDDYNDSLALYTLNTRWIATARARLGYSTGPALLYVTGGGAWVNYKESWDFGSGPDTSSKTLGGYTVGAGIETLFSLFGPDWSTRTEYLYVNVGTGDALIDRGVSAADIAASHQFHLFRSALVYHFGH